MEQYIIFITILFLFFSTLMDFRKYEIPNPFYYPLLCFYCALALYLLLIAFNLFLLVILMIFISFLLFGLFYIFNAMGGGDVKVTLILFYAYLLQVAFHTFNEQLLLSSFLTFLFYWDIFALFNIFSSYLLKHICSKWQTNPLVPYLFLMFLFLSFNAF